MPDAHFRTPSSSRSRTRAGTASAPVPRTVACCRGWSGTRSARLRQSLGLPLRLVLLDGGPFGPQPSWQGWVAGKVDAFLDRDHRGQTELERLLAAAVLPPGPRPVPGDLQVLDPVAQGQPSPWAPHPHLVVPVSAASLPSSSRSQPGPSAARRRTSATIAAAVAGRAPLRSRRPPAARPGGRRARARHAADLRPRPGPGSAPTRCRRAAR